MTISVSLSTIKYSANLRTFSNDAECRVVSLTFDTCVLCTFLPLNVSAVTHFVSHSRASYVFGLHIVKAALITVWLVHMKMITLMKRIKKLKI